MLRGFGFRLRKWYVDCVSADGTAFIGYAARIGLGPLPLVYQAALWSPPAGPGSSDFTMVPAQLPRLSGAGLHWESRRLGIPGSWHGSPAAIRHVLLDTSAHFVEWRCHLPVCEASIESPAGNLRGPGYAEELLMRGNPASLPIQELCWGRFSSGDDHVVWIEWMGAQPLRVVLVNGSEVEATRADDKEVQSSRGVLTFRDRRVIRSERVEASAFGDSRWRRRLVPRAVADWREEKWLSRGRLEKQDGAVAEGWVVHERVTWP